MKKLFLISLCLIIVNAQGEENVDWYDNGVFYQIYVRSFKDSDGDGIGDIRGIIENLDHLVNLGVDGAILSPIFKSPMKDGGYDIQDFRLVDPIFGSNEDLKELIAKGKEVGIKIILDFVPNHTSDEHEWFIRSVNQVPGYEDYYIWRDCPLNPDQVTRRLRNNWITPYNTEAWTYHPTRDQCYLHQFLSEQPDLNFRNWEVYKEMLDVIDFWLREGVDGFRFDKVNHIFEDADLTSEEYRNASGDRLSYANIYHRNTRNLPESYEFIYDARTLIDDFTERSQDKTKRIIITDAYATAEEVALWYGSNEMRLGSHIPLNFQLISEVDESSNAIELKYAIDDWIDAMPRWEDTSNWILGNQDRQRMVHRYGEDRFESLAVLTMMLPGVNVLYYGEEIGMTNNMNILFEECDDPQGCLTNSTVFLDYSRDPVRTPFQWDDSANAGFSSTTGKTWLPVHEKYQDVNLKQQKDNVTSTFSLYQRLVDMRKERKIIQIGGFESKVLGENDGVLGFIRTLNGHNTIAVMINCGSATKVNLTQLMETEIDERKMKASIILTTSKLPLSISNLEEIALGEFDAVVFEVSSSSKLTISLSLMFCIIVKLIL